MVKEYCQKKGIKNYENNITYRGSRYRQPIWNRN